jgi:hypothetical protein
MCILMALAVASLLAGCHASVGNGPRSLLQARVVVPVPIFTNNDVTWQATIAGGQGPYTVTWDFGGGAVPNAPTYADQPGPTSTSTVRMVAGTWFVRVTVTDSLGEACISPPAAYQAVTGQDIPPQIDSAVWDPVARTITVGATDVDDHEMLEITLRPPARGFSVDVNSKHAATTGPLTAVFRVRASDILAGASGNFGITVDDTHSTPTELFGGLNVSIPPLTFSADTLYAIPMTETAQVGEPVTVLVATGPTAHPYEYMNGVGLTMPSDGKYIGGDPAHGGTGDVPGTFNLGAPGGNAGSVDGFWTAMAPSGGFLLPPDNFIQSVDAQPAAGSQRFDFNVTPLGGSNQITASGALFNAQFRFSTAGTKTFGFQQLQSVKRTYYSDDTPTEYFWGDISNNQAGVPHAVVVR